MKKILFLLAVFFGAAILNASHAGADGFPQYTRTDYPTNGGAAFMHVGTENSDTYPDLIVISPQGVINVLLGGPNAVFGTAVVTITGISIIRNYHTSLEPIIADDFNNDGYTDICIKDTLFVATGDGGFSEPKSLGIENLRTITSADMNRDGNKDLIAIVIIYTSPTTRAAELRTYFGNGDGTFQEPATTGILMIDDSALYHIFHAGDFTGDGVPDLVVRHTYIASNK